MDGPSGTRAGPPGAGHPAPDGATGSGLTAGDVILGILCPPIGALVGAYRLLAPGRSGRGLALLALSGGTLLVGTMAAGMLAALILPSLQRVRERADRTCCANQLKMIHIAAMSYMDDQPARQRLIPHARAFLEPDRPEDVARCFALLVQFGYLDDPDDPEIFACPSSGVVPAGPLAPGDAGSWNAPSRYALRRDQVSYAWSREARGPRTAGDTPIAADGEMGGGTDGSGGFAGDRGRRNHGLGRNALRFNGRVDWVPAEDVAGHAKLAEALALGRAGGD